MPKKTAYFNYSILLLWISIGIMNGCSPVQIQNIAPAKAASYNYFTDQGGVKISADPFFEEERLKKYFGANLMESGFLPILLVIENEGHEDGILLLKEKTKLLAKAETSKGEGKGIGPDKDGTKIAEDLKGATLAVGSLTMLMIPVVTAVVIPALFIIAKAEMDAAEVNRNIQNKALSDKTLYPGGSHYGFIYFNLKQKEDTERIEGLELNIQNIRTKTSQSFRIRFRKD